MDLGPSAAVGMTTKVVKELRRRNDGTIILTNTFVIPTAAEGPNNIFIADNHSATKVSATTAQVLKKPIAPLLILVGKFSELVK